MKKLVLFLALLAIFLTASVSAANFVSVGTNYNLPDYHYASNGWQTSENCNTFYPNNSISSYYYDAYGSKVEYYPRCAYFNNYYTLVGELRPPLPYPYIASPRDLGYSPVAKHHGSGSRANAYYANTVQVHLNDIGSTTYPPSLERNSLSLANSYSNYGQQQYYLSNNAQPIPSEGIDSSKYTYAYSGQRWLTTPNYWYERPGAGIQEPATSSTFPPAVFIGFYQSNDPRQYYDEFQVNEPVKAIEAKAKKKIVVASQ